MAGGGNIGKGNWADPTGLIQKSGAGKILDPLGLTKTAKQGESAADVAARMEMERQERIREAQGRINQVFDNPRRARDIADFVSATRTKLMDDLNRQNTDAARELKFSLARGGLSGGSVAVDQNRRMSDDYNRGALTVESRAQGAGAQLEAADQDQRARLIQLATSGLDANTGAQQAAAGLRSNLEAARSTAFGEDLADQFGGIGAFVKQRRDEANRREATRVSQVNLYGGGYGGYGG
ncbi:TPA: hypothetical protein ACOFB9_000739 [Stenotrophomonas maltophilia]|uniref:hypothetical protein n=1 Tax=Stenotrophomonas maltophilia TaxID=40324 RepID=UPI0018D3CDF2|nr:hypothetical protein [Stenotrophomonas maltophilia]MBH1676121.1 hypothetical protein [Stenotrophomonas maltophilia]MDZ5777626.1 hypothetical protein [Stenotrophomonas maltophilia]HEL3740231.1 hypothetical protein [Stenotrophomonas maltophilia]HEL3760459.1 hypothetical protein [Stenotrophomonas maltophilia]